ncbi:MAG TPA: hypothetical protein VLX92_33020 [Kofleriaceae bacterium]|nr:hypothetical protein [Kofleriaceae bacterium]
MTRLAVIAGILFAGSLASAGPPDQPYHQPDTSEWIQPHAQRFFALGNGYASMSQRQHIRLPADLSRLTDIRLQALDGNPFIRRVIVRYVDGAHDTFRVDKWLGVNGDNWIDLSLPGDRRVERIIVLSKDDGNATYAVMGKL